MTLEGWLANETDHPMYIFTAASSGRVAGCLVGFATQCSIEPLLFVAFISRKNATYRVARDAGFAAVHMVPADRKDLAVLFGGRTGDRDDKFAACAWHARAGGTPVLDGVRSWFVGRIVGRCDAGDHTGFLLEPVEGAAAPHAALGFSSVRDLEPGHPP